MTASIQYLPRVYRFFGWMGPLTSLCGFLILLVERAHHHSSADASTPSWQSHAAPAEVCIEIR